MIEEVLSKFRYSANLLSEGAYLRFTMGQYDPVYCTGWALKPVRRTPWDQLTRLHEFVSHSLLAHWDTLLHETLLVAEVDHRDQRYQEYIESLRPFFEGVVLASIYVNYPRAYHAAQNGQKDEMVRCLADAMIDIHKSLSRLLTDESHWLDSLPSPFSDWINNALSSGIVLHQKGKVFLGMEQIAKFILSLQEEGTEQTLGPKYIFKVAEILRLYAEGRPATYERFFYTAFPSMMLTKFAFTLAMAYRLLVNDKRRLAGASLLATLLGAERSYLIWLILGERTGGFAATVKQRYLFSRYTPAASRELRSSLGRLSKADDYHYPFWHVQAISISEMLSATPVLGVSNDSEDESYGRAAARGITRALSWICQRYTRWKSASNQPKSRLDRYFSMIESESQSSPDKRSQAHQFWARVLSDALSFLHDFDAAAFQKTLQGTISTLFESEDDLSNILEEVQASAVSELLVLTKEARSKISEYYIWPEDKTYNKQI